MVGRGDGGAGGRPDGRDEHREGRHQPGHGRQHLTRGRRGPGGGRPHHGSRSVHYDLSYFLFSLGFPSECPQRPLKANVAQIFLQTNSC